MRPLCVFAGFVSLAMLVTVARGGIVDEAEKALEKGDYEKATALAERVSEKSKERPDALCVVGRAELAQFRFEEAEKAFRSALELKKDHLPAMAGLGRALTGLKRHAEAVRVTSEAVEADRKNIDAWLSQCAAFIARGKPGDLEGALTNLEATLFLDRKHPDTNRMIVETLLDLEREDDADAAVDRCFKADKDGANGWFLRGRVQARRGNPEKALEAWRKAVKKDPRHRDAQGAVALAVAAANPKEADEDLLRESLDAAKKHRELGGRDPAVLALLERLQAVADAAAK